LYNVPFTVDKRKFWLDDSHVEKAISIYGLHKTRLYEAIAEWFILNKVSKFMSTDEISKTTNIDKDKVCACMSKVRHKLAIDGYVLVNKLMCGYRLGTIDEFEAEADKACRRAAGHFGAYALISRALEISKFKHNVDSVREIIQNNLDSVVRVLENKVDFSDEQAVYAGHLFDESLVPDFIKDIPNERYINHDQTKA
jgi:hypothetical protein